MFDLPPEKMNDDRKGGGAHATFVHRGPHNEHNWKFLVAALCIEDSLDSSNFVSCPMTNKRPSLAKNHKLMIYYGF